MLSRNEWDPLEHVIVGLASDARVPDMDIGLRTINYSHLADVSAVPRGPYPIEVIHEANEDLETLCAWFTQHGIKVSRPDPAHVPAYYNYCPRDSVVILAHEIIEAPMPLRVRALESQALHHVFRGTDCHRWISCRARRPDSLYNTACVGNADVLALTDEEAAFDAANVLRANDDIFYLVSNSGNLAGARLLQDLVGSQRRVWPLQGIYSYMHIDSTLALLREGLLIANPSRIRDREQLPAPLRKWDIIWAPDPGDVPHYPGWVNSSRWVSMNVFSPGPDVVLIERNQPELARLVERHGVQAELLPMRQARTLGGSFHCVTLDIRRQHD
jgi:N-dimethylarginine dimethylaminohydrolase